MFSEPKYLFIIGLAGGILFLAIQLLFCFKARKTFVKLIPVYIIILGISFCFAIYCGIMGISSGFIGNANKIAALILAMVIGIICMGETVAWVIYGLYRRKNR